MKYLVFNLVFWIFIFGNSVHGQQKEAIHGNWYDNFSRVGLHSAISFAITFDSHGHMWISTNGGQTTLITPRLKKWDGRSWTFKDPGFDHNITAMVFDDDDNLYVGGTFQNIGEQEAAHVAMYDGTQWHNLGSGLSRSGSQLPQVRSMHMHNGNLYVGGIFDQAGSVNTFNIARWNGSEWSQLSGLGMAQTAHVNDMIILDDMLWMATQNADFNNGLIRYDLEQNTLLDPLIGSMSAGQHMYSISAGPGDKVYLSGNFTSISGQPIVHVGYYDTEEEEFQPMGGGAGFNGINHIRAHENGNVFVGGSFTEIDTVDARYIAMWDGTQWHDLDGGLQGRRNIGSPNVLTSADVNDLAFGSDGQLYVAGRFQGAGDKIVYRVARWDGEEWYALGKGLGGSYFFDSPASAVRSISQLQSGEILVGGSDAFSFGGKIMRSISAWDPGQENWRALDGGLVGNVMTAVEDEEGIIYAGGAFIDIYGDNTGSRIAKFDGEHWTGLGEDLSGTVNSLLIAHDGTLYAGGTGGGINFHRWNGEAWESVFETAASGIVRDLALTPNGDVLVGGEFTRINGDDDLRRIALWDGEEFHALGNGILGSGVVIAITFTVLGEPVVAGTFNIGTDGGDDHRVAVFRDGEWQALGEGLRLGSVNALVTGPRGEIYAGGRYINDLEGDFIRLSVWNGEQWLPFYQADDLGRRIHDLLIDNNGRLWAGGYFTHAGDMNSYAIAMWSGEVQYLGDYRLSIDIEGAGATDPGQGDHLLPAGETVTVNAISEPGYRLDHWLLDGENITDEPISFVLDYNTNLKAVFVEDGTTSVADAEDPGNLRVFPNPAISQISIMHDTKIQKVILSDLSGRIVKLSKVNTTETSLNVSALQTGIYILEVITENEPQRVKVWVR